MTVPNMEGTEKVSSDEIPKKSLESASTCGIFKAFMI